MLIRGVFKISALWGVFLLLALPVHAERKNSIGGGIDFMGGVSNHSDQSSFNLTRYQKKVTAFYSIYPSLSLTSTGQYSTFNLDYTFVAERFEYDPPLTITSHAVNAAFAAQLGVRVSRGC